MGLPAPDQPMIGVLAFLGGFAVITVLAVLIVGPRQVMRTILNRRHGSLR